MKAFLFALQFLTIIPVKIKSLDQGMIRRSMVYFPLAGLLIGSLLSGENYLLSFFPIKDTALNIILVISLIFLTGGIHLDGLADTADAVFSGKDKQEMLRIMRDPHNGSMGVLSLVSVVLLKIALLSSVLGTQKIPALLLACTLSRWSQVLIMFIFPYARQEGKAEKFMRFISGRVFIFSTVICVSLSFLIWAGKGVFLMAISAAIAYLTGKNIVKKIGGITGDNIGAINEVIESAVLLVFAVS